ncbi:MAG TPA: thioredoxin family protein [Bacteroidota bacterium]|nr:thioredoxin family protein [Bacteroidota bacterium]
MQWRWAIFCVALLFAGCGDSYQVVPDPYGQKVITGRMTPALLASDSSFGWYRKNFSSFTPDSASVAYLSTSAQDIHFIVIGGTWCGDTKRELPKFFKTMEAAHIPESHIELYGVDRSKENSEHSAEKYDVVSVPTFIVISHGKEIGRIVEQTKKGIEFDLVDILKEKQTR